VLIDESLSEECKAFLRAREAPWEAGPEPTVPYWGRRITIREACKLVPLLVPADMIVPEGYYPGLPDRPTYAEAADDLLAIMDYHAERLEQIASHREAIEALTTSM
jgi:hypothetical protein